jgi:hypothetical protein
MYGKLKTYQLSHLAWSPFIFLIGLFGLLVRKKRMWIKPLVFIIISTSITYGILEYGGNYYSYALLHTSPYSLLLMWIFLCVLGATSYQIFACLQLFSAAIVFMWFWVIYPIYRPKSFEHLGSVQFMMTFFQISLLSILLFIAYVSIRKNYEHGDKN